MKKVLITGATGMVGGHVLNILLDRSEVGEIVSVSRKSTGIVDEKLKEIIHSNFLDFSDIAEDLTDIDVCFYCIGVYTNAVSKSDFLKVTCDYQKAFTDILEQTSPNLSFCLFSAAGADTSEQSGAIFSKAKGKAENLLRATCFPKKYIFRPAIIHPTGKKRPRSWDYILFQPLYSGLFKLIPSLGITDKDLAAAMVNVGLSSTVSSQVFENNEIKRFL